MKRLLAPFLLLALTCVDFAAISVATVTPAAAVVVVTHRRPVARAAVVRPVHRAPVRRGAVIVR
jgi:hypothetical protein